MFVSMHQHCTCSHDPEVWQGRDVEGGTCGRGKETRTGAVMGVLEMGGDKRHRQYSVTMHEIAQQSIMKHIICDGPSPNM